MLARLWPLLALIGAPALGEPIKATGIFTRCVSDSCEIVVDGLFAYVEGGYGTPTDLMIALYELDGGVQRLEIDGEMVLRDDGFAELVLSDFKVLPEDETALFLQSLQGNWVWADQADDLRIEFQGLQWAESRPTTARERWKVIPAKHCPGGETPANIGSLIFHLSPWRGEPERPGCWEIISRTADEVTLRDLTDPQGGQMVLRAAP